MSKLLILLLLAIIVALFVAPSYQRKVDKDFLQYEEVFESMKALRKAYSSLNKKGLLQKHFTDEDLMYLIDEDDAEVLFLKKIGKGLKKIGKGAIKFVKSNLPALALGAVTGGVGGVAMAAAKSAAKKVAFKALDKVTKGKFSKVMGGKFGGLISAAAGGFAGGGGIAGAGKALLKAGKNFAVDKAKEFGMKKLDKVTKGKFSQLYGRFGSIAEAGIGGFKNGGGMKGAFRAAAREGKSVLINEGKNFAMKKLNKITKGKFEQFGGGDLVEAGINGFRNGGGMRGALRAVGREGKSILINQGKNFAINRLNKITKGKFEQFGGSNIVEAGINGFRNGGGMRGALRAAGREGKSVLIDQGKRFVVNRLNKATRGKFERFGGSSLVDAGVNGFRNGGGMRGAFRAAGRQGKTLLLQEGRRRLDKLTKGQFGKFYDRYGNMVQSGIRGLKQGGLRGALESVANTIQQAPQENYDDSAPAAEDNGPAPAEEQSEDNSAPADDTQAEGEDQGAAPADDSQGEESQEQGEESSNGNQDNYDY